MTDKTIFECFALIMKDIINTPNIRDCVFYVGKEDISGNKIKYYLSKHRQEFRDEMIIDEMLCSIKENNQNNEYDFSILNNILTIDNIINPLLAYCHENNNSHNHENILSIYQRYLPYFYAQLDLLSKVNNKQLFIDILSSQTDYKNITPKNTCQIAILLNNHEVWFDSEEKKNIIFSWINQFEDKLLDEDILSLSRTLTPKSVKTTFSFFIEKLSRENNPFLQKPKNNMTYLYVEHAQIMLETGCDNATVINTFISQTYEFINKNKLEFNIKNIHYIESLIQDNKKMSAFLMESNNQSPINLALIENMIKIFTTNHNINELKVGQYIEKYPLILFRAKLEEKLDKKDNKQKISKI